MAAGVYLSLWVSLPLWLFFTVLAVVAASYLLAKRFAPLQVKIWWMGVWLAGALLFCAGMLRGGAVMFPRYTYVPDGGDVALSGTLAESPSYSKGWYSVRLVDVRVDGDALGYGVNFSSRNSFYGQAGDRLTSRATLSFPSEELRLSMLSKNTGYYAQSDSVQVLDGRLRLKFIPARIAGRIRQAIESMYGDDAPLVNGMLLGYKAGMDDETRAAFSASGTAHILAVSGLHMGFMAAMAAFLAKRLRPALRFGLVTSLLWLYCFVVGAPTSAVRACLMSTCAIAGDALGQKNDLLSSMSAAALIILAINPAQLFTWGFQLSFAAVYGIAMFETVLTRLLTKKLPTAVGSAMSVSLSAQLGLTPVLLKIFGYVQPLAVFANLIIVPMAAAITMGALVSAGLHMLSPVVAAPLAWVVQGLARAMRLAAEGFSSIPFATIDMGFISLWRCIVLLGLLFFISPVFLRKGGRRLPALLAAVGMFLLTIILA